MTNGVSVFSPACLSAFLDALKPVAGWAARSGCEACVVAAGVLIVQRLLRGRVSARWRYNLWLLVIARLLLPALPGVPVSPFNLPHLLRPTLWRDSQATVATVAKVATPATTGGAVVSGKPEAPRAAVNAANAVGAPPVAPVVPPPAPRTGLPSAPPVAADPVAAPAAPSAADDLPPAVELPVPPLFPDPSDPAPRHDASSVLSGASAAAPRTPAFPAAPGRRGPAAALGVCRPPTARPTASGAGAVASVGDAPGGAGTAAAESLSPTPTSLPARHVTWADLKSHWLDGLAALWALGAAAAVVRLLYASARLALIVRRLPEVRDPHVRDLLRECCRRLGVRRAPALLGSAECEGRALGGPALVGLLRPRILVPGRLLDQLDHRELRLVLLHELAHLKRRDVAANCVIGLLQAVHWFNPVLYSVFRQVRADRELACDELALSAASREERREYGPTILKLLELLSPGPVGSLPRGAVGILEGNAPLAQLQRRLRMIARFDRGPGRAARWSVPGVGLTLLLGAVALTGAVRAQDRPPEAQPPEAQPPQAPPAAPSAAPDVVQPSSPQPPAAVAAPAAPAAPDVESLPPAAPAGPTTPTPLIRPTPPAAPGAPGAPPVPGADPAEQAAAVDVARADLQAAQAELALRAAEFERAHQGAGQAAVSAADLDKAKYALAKAQAGVAATRARLDMAAARARAAEQAAARSPGVGPPNSSRPGARPGSSSATPPVEVTRPVPPPGAANTDPTEAAVGSAPGGEVIEDADAQQADAQTLEMLHKPIGSVKLEDTGLSDAVNYLGDLTKVDFVIDNKSLRAAGIGREPTVHLVLNRPVPAEQVLRWVLNAAGNEQVRLGFSIDHGVVFIATLEQLNQTVVTRVYDIQGLVNRTPGGTPENLIQLIKGTVAPDTWKESGDGVGALREFNGKLVVTQTEPNQRSVCKLLGLLEYKAAGAAGAPSAPPAAGTPPAPRAPFGATGPRMPPLGEPGPGGAPVYPLPVPAPQALPGNRPVTPSNAPPPASAARPQPEQFEAQ